MFPGDLRCRLLTETSGRPRAPAAGGRGHLSIDVQLPNRLLQPTDLNKNCNPWSAFRFKIVLFH